MAQNLVWISNEWMLRPRIEAASQRAGWEFSGVPNLSALLQTDFQTAPDRLLVLIDLPSALQISSELLTQLRATFGSLSIVAFGPHVQEAALQEALDIGCDAVWTNGQLQHQINSGSFPELASLES